MSVLHQLPELTDVETVGLLSSDIEASSELILGRITISPGESLPLHSHPKSETLFLLEGAVRVQRGRAVCELHAPAAAYIPAGTFHRVNSLGQAPSSLLLCYSRATGEQAVETKLATPDADPSTWPNPNTITGENLVFRWAVAEEYEPVVGIEPSKGMKLTVRYLFDPRRGTPDLAAGTCRFEPNVHFTIHRHEPPEIYYVLDGAGIVHVADEELSVSAGSAMYIPGGVTHGIDTFDRPIHFFWLYGLDRSGPNWTWEAVEDVYDFPRAQPPRGQSSP